MGVFEHHQKIDTLKQTGTKLTNTMSLPNNDELVIKMKKSYDITRIKENPLRTYYTCVRYSNTKIGTSHYTGPFGTGLTHYGPGRWSCIKGWFETDDNYFQGNRVDSKVLNYCKFRNTEEALKKDINDEFILYIPKETK